MSIKIITPAVAIGYLAVLLLPVFFIGCSNGDGKNVPYTRVDTLPESNTIDKYDGVRSEPDSVLAEGEIPVLCFHQVRDWKPTDTKSERVFITPVATFAQEMKMLHDSGFHYILPDQLIAYMKTGKKLPPKPIMLTFDDATASQYVNALPELNKNGFKGVFFIMTVVLNHANYMSRENVKELARQGNIIGCHTWNHKNVTQYTEDDWAIQIEKPVKELENITGMPVAYFAYPYGAWNANAVDHLKKYHFTAAFRLWGKYSEPEPFYTIRRILVDGHWDTRQLLNAIKKDPLKLKGAVASKER